MAQDPKDAGEAADDRFVRLERRFDVLTAELAAATAGRDRAHEDIAKLLEYFEFCLTEIARLDDRIDSDVRTTATRLEDDLRSLKERAADTSAQLQVIRSDQQSLADNVNGQALQTTELLAELHDYEVSTRTAADAAAFELAELANRLQLERQERADALRMVVTDGTSERERVEQSLNKRVDELIAERDALRNDLDQLVAESVGVVRDDVDSLQARLDQSNDALAELRTAVAEVAGRDVVDRDDYAVLVSLAEELEISVGAARVLADEAMSRSASVEASVANTASRDMVERSEYLELAERTSELDGRIADVDAAHWDRVDIVDARLTDFDNEARKNAKAIYAEHVSRVEVMEGIVAEREAERARIDELVAGRVSAVDESLAQLRGEVAAVAGRDVVDRDDYAALVSLAEELEISVGEARVLADEALSRSEAVDAFTSTLSEQAKANTEELDALINERFESFNAGRIEDREELEALIALRIATVGEEHSVLRAELERVNLIDERVAAIDEATRTHADAVDALAAGRGQDRSELEDLISGGLTSLSLERAQDRSELEDLVSRRLNALSSEREQDRSELEALDERIEALSLERSNDRAYLEEAMVEQLTTFLAERDQLRLEIDELIRERVDALIADRDEIRKDLERLVAAQAGEFGADVASLGDRLETSDGVLADLRSAIDEVSGRDVVERTEYNSVAALAEDLELAVAEARVLADQAIDQLREASESSETRHDALVKHLSANEGSVNERLAASNARHDELAERIDLTESALQEQHDDLVEQLESVEVDLREQSKALLSAAEETLELSIKAADKADSAADNADVIRLDHEDHVSASREAFEAHTERIDVVEQRHVLEAERRRSVDTKFREEIDDLVGRLAEVERSVSGSEVVEIPEPEVSNQWQFERRRVWGSPTEQP